MKVRKDYDHIAVLEVEISSFSGGGYKVKYDFKKKLISWNDGYMWNNNFCKSLTPAKCGYLRENLPDTCFLDWIEAYSSGEQDKLGISTANPSSWKISVTFEDGEYVTESHTKHFPSDWGKLKKIIETTTECTFRLH